MTIMRITIPVGLGDLIYVKAILEPVKQNYERIEICYNKYWLAAHDSNYPTFINQIGNLLFNEPPYSIVETDHPHMGPPEICSNFGIAPSKPELANVLCKGTSLDLGSEYIVMTTKIRWLRRDRYNEIRPQLFSLINKLTDKYKLVVLGEREVEMNKEYQIWGTNEIYCIYNDIIQNVPADKLLDRTIPVLGITSSDISQVQQDCLIMRDAKMVVTLGLGGNFCMATAVANTVGYRNDGDPIADRLFSSEHPKAKITKDWNRFVQIMESYL